MHRRPTVPMDVAARGLQKPEPPPSRDIPRTANIPPFWQFKPPSGVDLYSGRGTGTLAAGAGSTLDLVFPTAFRLLDGYKGVLSTMLITVLAPLTTLDITFVLLNQGGPVQGWNFSPEAVAANSITQPFNGPLQLQPRAQLTVRVINNAASGPWVVAASLLGWQWSRFDEELTFGYAG